MITDHVASQSFGSATLCGISMFRFKATLEELLERTIVVFPTRLPRGFAGCRSVRASTDGIGYNARIPVLTLEVVTHIAGHLALGHCEAAQSNGRFACSLSQHPGRYSSVRVFSDNEEHMAGYFAAVMLRLFDVTPIQSSRRPLFTCVDPPFPRRYA